MTYTDKYKISTLSDFEEENYPTAFGITFTPQVSGITLGILGVLAALYIIFNFGVPVFENYQKNKQLQQEKQQEIDIQKSQNIPQKFAQAQMELKQAKITKARVLSLFSSQQTIDTLLFDISKIANGQKIKITSFEIQDPEKKKEKKSGKDKALGNQLNNKIKVVNDGSLGNELNGKLKEQSIDMAIEGSFENTQKFLQELERLQPLLLVSNVNVSLAGNELVGTISVDQKNNVKVMYEPQNKLNTSFTLRAILPLNAEELEKVATKEPEEK